MSFQVPGACSWSPSKSPEVGEKKKNNPNQKNPNPKTNRQLLGIFILGKLKMFLFPLCQLAVLEPGSQLIKSVSTLLKDARSCEQWRVFTVVYASQSVSLSIFLHLLKEFFNFYVGFLSSRVGFPAREGGCGT